MGKRYTTNFLVDTNGNTGASGQVLISTSTGVNWSNGSDITGGPYLPLSAGSLKPLTGDLFVSTALGAKIRLTNTVSITTSNVVIGSLEFYSADNSGNLPGVVSSIVSKSNDSFDGGAPKGADLYLNTYVESEGLVTRMKIEADGKIGIGTTDPQELLHVYKNNATATLEIQGGLNSITAVGQVNAELNFGSNDGSATGGIGGSIKSVTEHANGSSVGMAFYTTQQGRSPVVEEAMHISSWGKVGINIIAPGNLLNVHQTDNWDGTSATAGIKITSATTSVNGSYHGTIALGRGTGSAAISAVQNGTDGDIIGMSFFTHPSGTGASASVEKMRINASGSIRFYDYGAGNLTTQTVYLLGVTSNGTIMEATTASLPGGPYLPVANPAFTGNLTGPTMDLSSDAKFVGFKNKNYGNGSTTTVGWKKIGTWGTSRGGGEMALSFTGGSHTPVTYIIKYYKDWTSGTTLKLEKYGTGPYISEVRIVEDTSTSNFFLEIKVDTAATYFATYNKFDMGYISTFTPASGALADGVAVANESVKSQLSFSNATTTVQRMNIGDYILPGLTPKLNIKANDSTNALSITNVDDIVGFRMSSVTAGSYFQVYDETGINTVMIDARVDATTRHTFFNNGGGVGIGNTNPSVNKLQVNGQVRVVGAQMIGDSTASNVVTAGVQLHLKNSGEAKIRLEDSDSSNLAFDILVNEGAGFSIKETVGGDPGDDTRLFIEETTGDVGLGTTTPGAKLDVAGGVRANKGFSNDTDGLKLSYPGGGSNVALGNSGTVGSIKITLPVSWSNTMMRMTIKVYEYTTNESFTLVCGGYNYGTGSGWLNEFAYIESQAGLDRNFTVRMGHDGTNCCIYIGELASVWQYPKVFVTDFEAGFSNATASTWQDGWNISMETSAFGTITYTNSGTQVNNWQRNGQDVYYGSGSGNVGIGTASPAALLHLNGTGDAIRVTSTNAGVGGAQMDLLHFSASPSDGDIMGYINMGGYYSGTSSAYFSSIRTVATDVSNRDGELQFWTNSSGTFAQKMVIDKDGNVGIGDTTPSYKLDVNGTIRATGDVIAYSDARVKDNVETIENALDKVTKLRGVSYTRNDVEDKTTKIGVIAQEVLEVLPEVVQQDDEGKYSVAYGNMVGLLIEAIKELKAEVDELKSRL